jgi:hypothetical protein
MSISPVFWSGTAVKATDILIASSLALEHGYTIMNYKASKCQSAWWKHLSPSATKKLKSARRSMLTVFWDSQGPVLQHYPERGPTVGSARYSDMLEHEPRPAIRTK